VSATPDDPIHDYLAGRVDDGWMPGAVWWVEGPGGPVSRGAIGNAQLEPRPEPADEQRPYDLASLTKPLLTAPLLVLAEQSGELALTDPVSRWLPELGRSPYAETSLLSLATHTAGLPAWVPLCAMATDLDGFLARIAEISPAAGAGEALYSDLGYILLGAAIERASRDRLDRLFASRIASPLKLETTRFAPPRSRCDGAAPTEHGNAYERELAGEQGRGYAWRAHPLQGEVHDANAHGLGGIAGHAGLFGTAEELATLARELLHPEMLALDMRAQARLLKPAPGGCGRTVGWVTAAQSKAAAGALPDDAPGHTGFTGTSIWLDPGARRFYILLTNRVHPTVPPHDFQPARLGFHRAAADMLDGASA
jgi:CubicO group peptidase (beta-lactamase class C family)